MSSESSPAPPRAPGEEAPASSRPTDLPGPDLDELLRPELAPSPRQRLDDTVQSLSSSPSRLVGAFLIVAVLAALGAYLLLRPGEPPAEIAIPTATPAPTSVTPNEADVADAEPVVHVAGAVVHPGVYVVEKGGRLSDAVEMAGGLTPQADPARVNLAQVLVDGSRHYIPAVGEVAPVVAEGSPGQSEVEPDLAGQALDLNSASASELEELPGVGPTTAEAIVEYRETAGPFRSVEELLEVRGIGDAKMAQLRDKVRV